MEKEITKDRLNHLLSVTNGGIWLSMDGNCGCALLGVNLVEGEVEFSEIRQSEIDEYGYKRAAQYAMRRALKQMHDRCGETVRWNTCNAPEFH